MQVFGPAQSVGLSCLTVMECNTAVLLLCWSRHRQIRAEDDFSGNVRP